MQINEDFYLRPVSIFDFVDIYQILSNETVTKYLNFLPMDNLVLAKRTVHDLYLHRLGNLSLTMSITNKESSEVIGIIGFYKYRILEKSCEIEFYLNEKFMNKGIMTLALEQMLDYGFNKLKLSKIYISHTKDNIACQKLTEKFNFTFDYIVKKYKIRPGYKTDIYHYYLKKINYEGK